MGYRNATSDLSLFRNRALPLFGVKDGPLSNGHPMIRGTRKRAAIRHPRVPHPDQVDNPRFSLSEKKMIIRQSFFTKLSASSSKALELVSIDVGM